ncbi:leucine--tRNA ligase [Candidatus Saccharibacteria bacterium oral taxon 955]|nr:leucine--tRNA ligase [Candidatus Saccharibacteria bacterium oral taxon 955]QJU05991.1 leucine--tRNA ligase [Candidatus Saccharibacteria bacterium oral taxon 955]
MKRYNPSDIEPKWQQIWSSDKRYIAPDESDKPKYYVTGMFPYPSGAGMHTGHFFEHSIVDAVARFRRALGYNVMYPMGFDNFGLPAENYAIKTGRTPQDTTAENIASFTNQLRRVGASIDWSREVRTSDPEYYKWTQWIFTKLFERDLAYQKEANQWWCPKDKTVLANEQVINGRCWRCEELVVKKPMKQWFFKITDYADSLLAELPALDWPDKIKTAQENWIGRSEGAEVEFVVEGEGQKILTVFTTRPDTLFGATFLVLAPEHPLVSELINDDTREAVESYISEAIKKSEIERSSEGKDKTGVFTGGYAINPANGEKVPIWVADYVLWGYGTGAIMAVPAHDERDFAFAEKFGLPIIEVVERPEDTSEQCYHGEGLLVNSAQFDGMPSSEAREQIVSWLEQQGSGRSKVTYRMRDWLISRQRYWGAPIPIIHCDKHGTVAVPESDLPVILPDVADFAPRGDGRSVLGAQEKWVNTTCPTCGGPARRETDTMDGYACSSWYLLRYTDPHNDREAWDPKLANYWAPLDMYVGGDHAVAHLLYVRFWTHVFYELGLTDFKEPVKKLVYHGLIQAEDGRKMSKSLGNVVDPLEVIDAGYGADALRTFELFLGPINENSSWNSRGIAGVYRFLNRTWTLTQEYIDSKQSPSNKKIDTAQLNSITHETIKKVTDDISRLSFNTAIASMMEMVNSLYKLKLQGIDEEWGFAIEALIQLVQPFAPHMAAELWQQLGHDTQIDSQPWPVWDEAKIVRDTMTIIVQVNGKLRAKLEVASGESEVAIKELALQDENVQKFVSGEPKKVIYIKNKLLSIVV